MSAAAILRPGHSAPSDGLYEVHEPDGTPTGVSYLVECQKPLPPTFRPKQFYLKVKDWMGRLRRGE